MTYPDDELTGFSIEELDEGIQPGHGQGVYEPVILSDSEREASRIYAEGFLIEEKYQIIGKENGGLFD